jgi:hypothetical protein
MRNIALIAALTAILACSCSTVPHGWLTANQDMVQLVEGRAAALLAERNPTDADAIILSGAALVMAQTYMVLTPTVPDKGARAALAIASGESWCRKWLGDAMAGRTLAAVAIAQLGLDKETTADAEVLVGILGAALAK